MTQCPVCGVAHGGECAPVAVVPAREPSIDDNAPYERQRYTSPDDAGWTEQ